MGAIQGAVNAMLGAVASGASVAKGISVAKESLQEKMAAKAMKATQDEINYKIKQQQLKNMKAGAKLIKAKTKQITEGGKQ